MKISHIFLVTLILTSCAQKEESISYTLKNKANFDLTNHCFVIEKENLKVADSIFSKLAVYDKVSKEEMMSQCVDSDRDGLFDQLLVRTTIPASEEKTVVLKKTVEKEAVKSLVYSRFVPERTDDYAWENDKVAFRTYGPTAQKMYEEGIPGGTFSSGIDCWLKKVDYLIINKWYAGNVEESGYYHKDHGEGLDNFHVGVSRGCGGTGILEDGVLLTSQNFKDWETLEYGPLRTSFMLDYGTWEAGDKSITEKKFISLDAGSHFMNVEVEVEGTEQLCCGLTLHEIDGEISMDTTAGWFSYYQPHGTNPESELGMALIVHPDYYDGFTIIKTAKKDHSHLLVHLKVIDGITKYKTGFAWKMQGEIKNVEDWMDMLNKETVLNQ